MDSNVLNFIYKIKVNGKKIALLLMNYLIILCYRADSVGGVLLIRLDNIGDFILWLDTAKVYRQLYPNQKITLAANPSWAELASSFPYWDEVISVDNNFFNKNWLYRWKLMGQFRQMGFETAIQPTYSRDFLVGDSLLYVTGARYRIGWTGDCVNIRSWLKSISDRWYTRLIGSDNNNLTELEHNSEFIRKLSGQTFYNCQPVIPQLIKLPSFLEIESPYCIIFPGSSWYGRQWSAEKFAQIALVLSKEYSWRIVICGGLNDTHIGLKVANLIGEDVINLVGLTSLIELTELIRNSVFLISNETSAIHIAVAVETPSVCILGGGHFGRFLPYPDALENVPITVFQLMPCFGCNWICTQGHIEGEPVPCIEGVTVEDVCNSVRQKLVNISP
jgi:ADP-heptose:LPS heptosyltransferase